MSRFGIYAVNVGTTVLGGITQQNVSNDESVGNESRSGEVYPRFTTLRSQDHAATFTTEDVATLLAAAPLGYLDIAALAGGIKMFGQRWLGGGTRDPASVHVRDAIVAGIFALRQLSASQDGDAMLSAEAAAQWDGSADPIARVINAAVPSPMTDSGRWGLGKITVAGILLTYFTNLTIDFGITIERTRKEHETWPRIVTIREIKPTITIRGINLAQHDPAVIPLLGLSGTHANTILYLRKRKQHLTFEADGTAAHVKIDAYGRVAVNRLQDGSGSGPSEIEITITCGYDGTNAPIVTTVNQAIV